MSEAKEQETPAPVQEQENPQDTQETTEEVEVPTRKGRARVEILRVLEALLFASDEVLTPARLKAIVPGQLDLRQIRKMIDTLNAELQSQAHPFEIVEVAGGYQFRTVSYYSSWVRQLFKEKTSRRLSIQGLECLAIIAYRQPLTKAEIEAVRGVVSDGAMKTLLERHLVTIAGRSDKAGRPLLYATTKEFLSYFGLRNLSELPTIEDFESLAKSKMGDLAHELEQLRQHQENSESPDTGSPDSDTPQPQDGEPGESNETAQVGESAQADPPAESDEVPPEPS